MKFESQLQMKLDEISSIFTELGAPEIDVNTDFVIDPLSWEKWVKLNLITSGKNRANLAITLASTFVQVDIDGTNEAFIFPHKSPEEMSDSAKGIIRDLLSNFILIERSNYRKEMHLFSMDGTLLKTFNLSTSVIGVVSKFFVENRDKRLFFPVYSKK